MKKIILLTVFVVIASAGSVFAQSRTMAVMPFDVVGNAVTADEVEALTELYISALTDTGMVKILDRTNFDKIMKELSFQTSDWSNSEKTAKLGQALNAKFISRGKIMKLGSKLTISVSIIDIQTAENVASTKASYSDIDDLVNDFFSSSSIPTLVKEMVLCPGPAGGIIFNASGNISYEVVFFYEKLTYNESLQKASSYSNGNYRDWRLPTKAEAELIARDVFSKYPDKKIDFWVYGTSTDYKYKWGAISGWTKTYFDGYNFYTVSGVTRGKDFVKGLQVTEGFSDSNKFPYCLVHSFTEE